MINTERLFSLCAAAGLAFLPACSDSSTCGPQTPPAAVEDLSIRYDGDNRRAVLTWTAPADDSEDDPAARYELRYSYANPLVWDLSLRAPDPPAPALPGAVERYEVHDPERGRDFYAVVRSYDAQGNASAPSNVAFAHIPGHDLEGRCVDVLSGEPVPGLDVTVTAGRVHRLNSGGDGRFAVAGLSGGFAAVVLHSGNSGEPFHEYSRPIRLEEEASIDCLMIRYQQTENPEGVNVLSLFYTAARISPIRYVFKKWRVYPIQVYVPPFFHNGLDFEQTARDAVVHWMDRTGLQIFTFVDTPPDTGVTMFFKTAAEMGIHVGITRHSEDTEGYPLKSDVDIVDTFASRDNLWVVVLHEMGHTIRLAHLPTGYLMHGSLQGMAIDITGDEVLMTQLYLALPNACDLSYYDISAPVFP